MKFFPLINVKTPTIVGILTCMSGKNIILDLTGPVGGGYEFLGVFILMSIQNFMVNWVGRGRSFIISGPGYLLLYTINVALMFDSDVCASDVVLSRRLFRDSMFES